MRWLHVLSLFVAVSIVAAAIGDENSLNEISFEYPTEESDADIDDDMFAFPDDDFDEVLIFSEDSEYEEIKRRSMSKYIQILEKINSDDASDYNVSNKEAFERNKKDSTPKSSPNKSKKRKKRDASCAKTDQPTLNCDAKSKYRTIDGSCNNLKQPEWGMAMGCQERLLHANYEGKAGFRNSVTGGPLPEPRTLSLSINTNESRPDYKRNHLSMFFGQFIAHDIVHTPMFATAFGGVLPCCQSDLRNDSRCANVYIEKNDPFYGPLNHFCLDFPRSVSCSSCDEDSRQLLNLNTAFLDGSLIYGSLENTSMSLRTNDGTGKLISQKTSTGELLPNSSDPQHDQCSFPDKDLICFRAGDPRVNQHLFITCLQTVFMRQHNRIVTKFKKMNPSWDEEKLFQETRRIVGAMIQVIVFKEYLPIVLGPEWIQRYGLGLSVGFTSYDDTVNPSIWIEFSTAGFRVSHSTINTIVSTKPRPVTEGFEKLRDLYSLPFGLRKGGFGQLIEDTTKTPAQMNDRFAVVDTTDYLYRIPGDPGGLDLAALDIQRGRDNGLPTYVQMVKFCHNIEIKDFEDPLLLLFMSLSNRNVLKKNYESVEDIDLETALQMETKQRNSIYGLTASCIVALQFHHLKNGDRYHFEHGDQEGSFKIDQINELKKTTLRQIICKNVDGITELPDNAMLFAFPLLNENVSCNDTQDLDFSKWKEEGG